ncbi:hypothetical protein M9H77_03394 [Catharanthus roseus]|uniref:Uncharacterized protein n=1 Tax=Catharanthus roseus TaxID=4058 RepID=A0ACC0CBK8_CATRO|nr:hypothetical protein M9H77_03394 [Catharanthus roseus]
MYHSLKNSPVFVAAVLDPGTSSNTYTVNLSLWGSRYIYPPVRQLITSFAIPKAWKKPPGDPRVQLELNVDGKIDFSIEESFLLRCRLHEVQHSAACRYSLRSSFCIAGHLSVVSLPKIQSSRPVRSHVSLKSFEDPTKIVAMGYLVCSNPTKLVGSHKLGPNFLEGNIQVAIVREEYLITSFSILQTIGEMLGVYIAWPRKLVVHD